jgi:hypothetical protein
VWRYLAVPHSGRGRGDWSETEYPPFWAPLVAQIIEERRDRLTQLWAKRQPACDIERMDNALREFLAEVTGEALDRLYPAHDRIGDRIKPARLPDPS